MHCRVAFSEVSVELVAYICRLEEYDSAAKSGTDIGRKRTGRECSIINSGYMSIFCLLTRGIYI
jgi:hypothetical protein